MDREKKVCQDFKKIVCGGIIKELSSIWALLELLAVLSPRSQVKQLSQLLSLAQSYLHNPLVLLEESKGSRSLLNYLMEQSLESSIGAEASEKLFEVISFLVYSGGKSRENMHFLYQLIANSHCDHECFSKSLKLLSLLQAPNKYPPPYAYFYCSGSGSGILLDAGKDYPFLSTFSCCFWLRLERGFSRKSARLLHFHCTGVGGVEAYFCQNRLFYRVLKGAYTDPEEGVFLCEVPYEEWVFLAIEHVKSRLGKHELRVLLNKNEVYAKHLEFPRFKGLVFKITSGGIFLDMLGQLGAAMLFAESLGIDKLKSLHSYYYYAPQGHEALISLSAVDWMLVSKMAMFYHPSRTQNGVVYDAVGRMDGRLIGLSGVKQIRANSISGLGGVAALLPIVSRIREMGSAQAELLDEWFQLLILCLKDRVDNQQEACKIQVFKALAELFLQLPPRIFTVLHIGALEDLKNCLVSELRDQLAIDLLWVFELWQHTAVEVQREVLRLLDSLHLKGSSTLSRDFGISRILEVLLQHHGERSLSAQEIPSGFIQVIWNIFIARGVEVVAEIGVIIDVLFSKPSIPILNGLLGMIVKLMSSTGRVPSALAKSFIEGDGIEAVLYFLGTSKSPETRELCLKCLELVFSFNLKVNTIGSPREICVLIGYMMVPSLPAIMGNFNSRILRQKSYTTFSEYPGTALLDSPPLNRKSTFECDSGHRRLSVDWSAHRLAVESGIESEVHLSGENRNTEERLTEEEELKMSPNRSRSRSISYEKTLMLEEPAIEEDEETVYRAIVNALLERPECNEVIDDSALIHRSGSLDALQEVVALGSFNLKHRAIQDLFTLTKCNRMNCFVLIQNKSWCHWQLNILKGLPTHSDEGVAVLDLGIRVYVIVLKEALNSLENGWKYLLEVLEWLDTHKHDKLAGIIVLKLFESLNTALFREPKDFLMTTTWKNLVISSRLIEEHVNSKAKLPDSQLYKALFIENTGQQGLSLLETLHCILKRIKPESNLGECKLIEESNNKIHSHMLQVASEKSDRESEKQNCLTVTCAESARIRRSLSDKLMKALTQWRGPWSTSRNYSYEPYPVMDCQFSRPLLKIRSSNHKFYIKATHPERLADSQLRSLTSELHLSQAPSQDVEEDPALDCEEKAAENPLAAVIEREESLVSVEVGWVMPLTVRYGILQLVLAKATAALRFVYDERKRSQFASNIELFQYKPSPRKPYMKEWGLGGLHFVIPKTYVMRHTAVEFLFTDGRSAFFTFASYEDRLHFAIQLRKLKKAAIPRLAFFKTPNPKRIVAESDMTERWVNWKISNFEYLMYLNLVSGRSFQDLTQYPVFPWVLAEYSTEHLDLSCKDSYRDLSKNMGSAGSNERLKQFFERYEALRSSEDTPPFHFGSHYSNPGIVLHYLTRLFPYCEGAKELQNGKFDLADRLFTDVAAAYESAVTDICDVRELIPEYFINPEIFLNLENLDLGVTQRGNTVNDVLMPRWAQNPFEFVRIHRQALESDHVSKKLNLWIDLIFGYKQKGPEAEAACNVFHYMTYEGSINIKKVEDPTLRHSLEAQVAFFGRTPSQLFEKPHPVKEPRLKVRPGPTVFAEDARLKVYLPAKKNPLPSLATLNNCYDLPSNALIKLVIIKDRDIVALRLNGNIAKYNWWSTPIGDTKTPFTCAYNKETTPSKELRKPAIESEDRSLLGFNSPVQLLNSGKTIALGGYWDGRLLLKKNNSCIVSQWKHASTISCIDVDTNERVGITGGKEGDVVAWQIETESWHPRWQYTDHDDSVESVAVSQELHCFASCSLDGTCNLYSLRNGKLLRVITLPHNTPAVMVKFATSPPAKLILFSPRDNAIYSFSINGHALQRVQERCFLVISPLVVRDLNFREVLVYATENWEVVVRDAGTLKSLNKYKLHNSAPILTLAVTNDQRFLLAGCADGEITILTDPESTHSILRNQWNLGLMLHIV